MKTYSTKKLIMVCFIAILLLGFGLVACDSDSNKDSDGIDDDGDSDDSDGDVVEPTDDKREIIVTAAVLSCKGCVRVSVCDRPPISEVMAIGLDVAPNNGAKILFASERQDIVVRNLPLNTCKIFEGSERDAIFEYPDGISVLDAGEISLSSQMSLLNRTPLISQYLEYGDSGTYPSVVGIEAEGYIYSAGVDLLLEAQGGDDVATFSLTDTAPEPIELITPHVDDAGQILNVAIDAPLEVSWTGADSFDEISIILSGEYCMYGKKSFAACRVENNGSFIIPLEIIENYQWTSFVDFRLVASRRLDVSASGLTGKPFWTVRSSTGLYIYYDVDAIPPTPSCSSNTMEEAFVGNACNDDSSCGGGCCLEAVDDVFANNYCTLYDCESNDDCPGNTICVEQGNPFYNLPNYCAKLCTTNDDCRDYPSYACLKTFGNKVCRPNML